MFVRELVYHGYVVEVSDETFTARVVDLADKVQGETQAEFWIKAVCLKDRDLIRVGALFYWVIGYHEDSKGSQHYESLVCFCRKPSITQQEIEKASKEAEDMCRAFGWD
jgi:pyrimidine deaminase RibD-like protein